MPDANIDVSLNVTGDAEQRIAAMIAMLDSLGQSISGASGSVSEMSGEFENAAQAAQGVGAASEEAVGGIKDGLTELKNQLLALFAVDTIKNAIEDWQSLQNQIKQVTNTTDSYNSAIKGVIAIANDTKSSFASVGAVFFNLSKSLNATQSEILALTSTISKAAALSGSSVEAQADAVMQLGQALAGGALRGDEFNSVNESANRIIGVLRDSLGKTTGELREMAEAGELTTDVLKKSLIQQAVKVSSEFDKMGATIGQSLQVLQNAFIETIGKMGDTTGATKAVSGTITALAGHMDALIAILGTAGLGSALVYFGNVVYNTFNALPAKIKTAFVAIEKDVAASTAAMQTSFTATAASLHTMEGSIGGVAGKLNISANTISSSMSKLAQDLDNSTVKINTGLSAAATGSQTAAATINNSFNAAATNSQTAANTINSSFSAAATGIGTASTGINQSTSSVALSFKNMSMDVIKNSQLMATQAENTALIIQHSNVASMQANIAATNQMITNINSNIVALRSLEIQHKLASSAVTQHEAALEKMKVAHEAEIAILQDKIAQKKIDIQLLQEAGKATSGHQGALTKFTNALKNETEAFQSQIAPLQANIAEQRILANAVLESYGGYEGLTKALTAEEAALNANKALLAAQTRALAQEQTAILEATAATQSHATAKTGDATANELDAAAINANTAALRINTLEQLKNAESTALGLRANTQGVNAEAADTAAQQLNSTELALNTSAIVKNTAELWVNSEALKVHTTNVMQDTSAIKIHTQQLEFDTKALTANTGALNGNTTALQTHTTTITSGANAIQNNTQQIIANQNAQQTQTAATQTNTQATQANTQASVASTTATTADTVVTVESVVAAKADTAATVGAAAAKQTFTTAVWSAVSSIRTYVSSLFSATTAGGFFTASVGMATAALGSLATALMGLGQLAVIGAIIAAVIAGLEQLYKLWVGQTEAEKAEETFKKISDVTGRVVKSQNDLIMALQNGEIAFKNTNDSAVDAAAKLDVLKSEVNAGTVQWDKLVDTLERGNLVFNQTSSAVDVTATKLNKLAKDAEEEIKRLELQVDLLESQESLYKKQIEFYDESTTNTELLTEANEILNRTQEANISTLSNLIDLNALVNKTSADRIKTVEKQIKTEEEIIAVLVREQTAIQAKNPASEKEILAQKNLVEQLSKQIDSRKSNIEAYQKEITTIEDANKKRETEINKLQETIVEKIQEIWTRGQATDGVEKETVAKKKSNEQAEEQIKKAREVQKELTSQVNVYASLQQAIQVFNKANAETARLRAAWLAEIAKTPTVFRDMLNEEKKAIESQTQLAQSTKTATTEVVKQTTAKTDLGKTTEQVTTPAIQREHYSFVILNDALENTSKAQAEVVRLTAEYDKSQQALNTTVAGGSISALEKQQKAYDAVSRMLSVMSYQYKGLEVATNELFHTLSSTSVDFDQVAKAEDKINIIKQGLIDTQTRLNQLLEEYDIAQKELNATLLEGNITALRDQIESTKENIAAKEVEVAIITKDINAQIEMAKARGDDTAAAELSVEKAKIEIDLIDQKIEQKQEQIDLTRKLINAETQKAQADGVIDETEKANIRTLEQSTSTLETEIITLQQERAEKEKAADASNIMAAAAKDLQDAIKLQMEESDRNIDLITKETNVKIKAIDNEIALAQARGDETKVAELSAEKLKIEIDLLEKQIAQKREQATATRDMAEAKKQEALADGILTDEEQAQVAALEDSAKALDLEADSLELDKKAKESNTKTTVEFTKTAITLQQAMLRLGEDFSKLPSDLEPVQKKFNETLQSMTGDINWMAASGRTFTASMDNAVKISMEVALAFAAQIKGAEKLEAAMKSLKDEYDRGDLSLSEYIRKLESLQTQYGYLDKTKLENLKKEIKTAKDSLDDLKNTVVGELKTALEDLGAMTRADAVLIENLSYAQKKAELEIQLLQAKGNKELEAMIKRVMELYDEAHKKRLQEIDQQYKEQTKSDNGNRPPRAQVIPNEPLPRDSAAFGAAIPGQQEPTKTVRLTLGKASLFGDQNSINEFINQLQQFGMVAA